MFLAKRHKDLGVFVGRNFFHHIASMSCPLGGPSSRIIGVRRQGENRERKTSGEIRVVINLIRTYIAPDSIDSDIR